MKTTIERAAPYVLDLSDAEQVRAYLFSPPARPAPVVFIGLRSPGWAEEEEDRLQERDRHDARYGG